ncbi:uncharacterized protein PADG_11740 [Paracoccidioides brasiliensis Pb18]|uniref:Uncharacterized protein n=1 Tax=Paracoccidioides brasiliensis (strain Pb18) TaxID=502780 RepID=A0A0A0HUC1_PARBD|nr:uncharacterized protein PADG_11740 [Paracoccidioides brasiliensis Pb18]KGM92202.1 hypothetical protein PADG_11740 [Paracoccidioides brasiliensis Pb18]
MRDEAEEWLVAVVEECAGNDDSSPPPPPLLITPDLSKLPSIDTTRGYPREDEWVIEKGAFGGWQMRNRIGVLTMGNDADA